MSDIKRTVDLLLLDPNPMARSFAIEVMLRNIHLFESDRLVELLKNASKDADARVAEKARQSMSRLLQWGFKDEQKIRDLGISSRMSTVSQVQIEQELSLRRSSEEPLKSVMRLVREIGKRPAHPGAPLSLSAMARSRSLEYSGDLINATSDAGLRSHAILALAHFKNMESISLIESVLENARENVDLERVASVLGELGLEDGVPLLRTMGTNAAESVREKAAQGLGGIRHPDAEEALLAMLERDENRSRPNILLAIFGSLQKVGKGPTGDRLVQLVRTIGDAKLFSRLLTTLGQLHSEKSFPLVLDSIQHADPRVRANAVEALTNFPLRPEDAVRYFDPGLRDSNNRVRANAIVALYSFDPNRAVVELKTMLSSRKKSERSSALWVVGEIQDLACIDAFTVLLNTEQDREILQTGLDALKKFRNPRLKPGVYPLTFHPKPAIKMAAIEAYARLSGPSSLKELDGWYDAADKEDTRHFLIRCMGELCETGSIRYLTKGLKERSPRLISAAIEGLDRVGAMENTVLLEPYTSHPNPQVRCRALVALWRMGNLNSVVSLLELLQARDETTIEVALETVCEIQSSMNWENLNPRPLLVSALSSRLREVKKGPVEGDYSKSLPRLTGKFELDRSDPLEVTLVKAVHCYARGEEARAREYVDEILAKDPNHEGAVFMEQRLGPSSGKPKDIPAPVLEKTLFLNLIAEEGKRAREARDAERILSNYYLIYERQLKILEQYVALGRKYLEKENQARATEVAKIIVSQMQWTQDLNQKLGFIYMEQEDHPKAFEALLRAYLSSGGDPFTGVHLAAVSLKLRKQDFAKKVLSRVMDASVTDARVKAMAQDVVKDLDAGTQLKKPGAES